MRDQEKSKEQLIEELRAIREENNVLKARAGRSSEFGGEAAQEPVAAPLEERNALGAIPAPLTTGLCLVNRDRTIAWADEQMARISPHDNPAGRLCYNSCAENQLLCPECPAAASFASGRVERATHYNPHHEKWYTITAHPVKDAHGETAHVLETITDITPPRLTAQTLLNCVERHRTVLDAASDGMWDYDAASGIIHFSDRFANLLGYDPGELKADFTTLLGMIHPEDLDRVEQGFTAYLAGQAKEFDNEYRLRTRSGDWIWTRCRIASMGRDAAGRPLRVLGIHFDVTGRKQAEAALAESESLIQRKLKAVLKPGEDLVTLELADILDCGALQTMMNDFYMITRVGIGIIDMKGKVLVATGWQDICSHYHRVHPETARACMKSDLHLSSGVAPGEFRIYRCKNNMWDIATPLIVGDKHVGNIFLGQFLFEDEEPDRETFRLQARKYGFDEEAYLAALDRVPRWSREKVNAIMRFYSQFAQMIASLSYGNIKLSQTIAEKDTLLDELRLSRERLSLAVEGTRVGLWDWRVQTGEVFFNEQWATMIGYTLKELHPLSIHTWIRHSHPEDLERSDISLQEHFRGDAEFYRCEARMRHKNGSWVWVLDQGKVFEWDDQGRPVRMAGTHQDITPLKLAQLELSEANRQLQRQLAYTEALLKAIPIPVFSKDAQGRYLDCNHAFTEFMGISAEDIRGKTVYELWPNEHAKVYDAKDADLLRTPKTQVYDFKIKDKDGAIRDVIFRKNVFFDEAGNPAGIIGGFLDITQLKEAEKELEDMNRNLQDLVDARTQDLLAKTRELETANDRLLALDELKSTFLTSVSHELRTPLTSILGFAKLIKREFSRFFQPMVAGVADLAIKGARLQANLEIIEHEGERLTRMINDFLDLTKIESGRLKWRDREFIPVDTFLRAATMASGLFAKESGVKLIVDVPQDLPVIFADPDRIEQVVLNLLNNAAKFTAQGRVTLAARATDEGALQFSVADTGEGIPSQERDKIFDKFHQVLKEDTLKTRPRGTGLGLAICRQILHHYGGRIWVESELGKGSTFYVELPAYAPARRLDRIPLDGEAPRTGPLVLVVDDESSICSYLSQLLTGEGYSVATAQNGRAALELARQLRPDCITMDIMMPGMDGNEVIALLRSDPDLAHVPILVITILQDYRNADVDAAVFKPINEEELLASLDSLLSRAGRRRPAIVLRRNGQEELGPYFALIACEIEHCSEAELWGRLESGFRGTIILPAWTAESVDLTRLVSHEGVQIIILPESDK